MRTSIVTLCLSRQLTFSRLNLNNDASLRELFALAESPNASETLHLDESHTKLRLLRPMPMPNSSLDVTYVRVSGPTRQQRLASVIDSFTRSPYRGCIMQPEELLKVAQNLHDTCGQNLCAIVPEGATYFGAPNKFIHFRELMKLFPHRFSCFVLRFDRNELPQPGGSSSPFDIEKKALARITMPGVAAGLVSQRPHRSENSSMVCVMPVANPFIDSGRNTEEMSHHPIAASIFGAVHLDRPFEALPRATVLDTIRSKIVEPYINIRRALLPHPVSLHNLAAEIGWDRYFNDIGHLSEIVPLSAYQFGNHWLLPTDKAFMQSTFPQLWDHHFGASCKQVPVVNFWSKLWGCSNLESPPLVNSGEVTPYLPILAHYLRLFCHDACALKDYGKIVEKK